jgi:predicted enzyme related to lactoylglutathione lyase
MAHASVHAIVIYVRDLDGMTSFYRDVLGMAVEHQTDHYAELRPAGGGAHVALHSGRAVGAMSEPHWFMELKVRNIDHAAAELRARGVEVGDVQERPFGRFAPFVDPEGNRLELEQPAGD